VPIREGQSNVVSQAAALLQDGEYCTLRAPLCPNVLRSAAFPLGAYLVFFFCVWDILYCLWEEGSSLFGVPRHKLTRRTCFPSPCCLYVFLSGWRRVRRGQPQDAVRTMSRRGIEGAGNGKGCHKKT